MPSAQLDAEASLRLTDARGDRQPDAYPQGRIVCTALVNSFRRLGRTDNDAACCDCASGRFGLLLTDIHPASPTVLGTRVVGHQGIWDVPADLTEQLV